MKKIWYYFYLAPTSKPYGFFLSHGHTYILWKNFWCYLYLVNTTSFVAL